MKRFGMVSLKRFLLATRSFPALLSLCILVVLAGCAGPGVSDVSLASSASRIPASPKNEDFFDYAAKKLNKSAVIDREVIEDIQSTGYTEDVAHRKLKLDRVIDFANRFNARVVVGGNWLKKLMTERLDGTVVAPVRSPGRPAIASFSDSQLYCRNQGMRALSTIEAAIFLQSLGAIKISDQPGEGFAEVKVEDDTGLGFYTPGPLSKSEGFNQMLVYYQNYRFYYKRTSPKDSSERKFEDQDLADWRASGPADFEEFYTTGWQSTRTYYWAAWAFTLKGDFFKASEPENQSRRVFCFRSNPVKSQ